MLKYYLICAVLVLHYYGAGAERTPQMFASMKDRVEQIIEELRQLMCKEIPSLGLPRLEPLYIDEFDFYLTHKVGTFEGILEKLTAKGLSNLVINNIKVSATLAFSADITITSLDAAGKYQAKGILADVFPIDGYGNLKLGLKNLRIILSAKIKFINDEFLITDLAITPTVEKITANIENIVPDKEVSDFINKALNTIGPQLFDALWFDISPDVIKLIEDLTKELGGDLTFAEIMKILLGEGPVFPETGGAPCFP